MMASSSWLRAIAVRSVDRGTPTRRDPEHIDRAQYLCGLTLTLPHAGLVGAG